MSGHSNYVPKTAFGKWMHERLPIMELVQGQALDFPTPKNLNYWWTFGGILAVMLVVQIVTGVVLVMHYTPHVDMAFNSVELTMRDVNYGWLLRYVHANGASMFFLAVYIHMFRGIYYGSYKEPREILWIIGVIIFLLMIATGFMGYVLPWGQMSYWEATVITNLFSAFPIVGEPIVTWLWGGYAVGNPTLQRFFSLHYLLPFVIVGFVWKLILSPIWGIAPGMLDAVGLKSLFAPWLRKEEYALTTLALVSVWQFVGIPMLLIYAALLSIPDEVIEAAEMDGVT